MCLPTPRLSEQTFVVLENLAPSEQVGNVVLTGAITFRAAEMLKIVQLLDPSHLLTTWCDREKSPFKKSLQKIRPKKDPSNAGQRGAVWRLFTSSVVFRHFCSRTSYRCQGIFLKELEEQQQEPATE